MPGKLLLNVNIYLDPTWHNIHGQGSVLTAKQVVKEASKLFNHPSLNTKIELIVNNVFNSTQQLRPRDTEKIGSQLRSPFEVSGENSTSRKYKVAHLYFTAAGRLVTGRGNLESICHEVEKPIAAIKWQESISRTAMATAHDIGHVLGMYHDFSAGKDTRTKTCGQKRKGDFLMNYGNSRSQWSDCSNEDFQIYYEKIVNSQNGFCLEEIHSS